MDRWMDVKDRWVIRHKSAPTHRSRACKTSRVNIYLCVFYILAIMPAFTHILTNTKRAHTHTHFNGCSRTRRVRACVKWGRGEDDEYTQKIKLGRAIKVGTLTA
jgi:hypothetical protein